MHCLIIFSQLFIILSNIMVFQGKVLVCSIISIWKIDWSLLSSIFFTWLFCKTSSNHFVIEVLGLQVNTVRLISKKISFPWEQITPTSKSEDFDCLWIRPLSVQCPDYLLVIECCLWHLLFVFDSFFKLSLPREANLVQHANKSKLVCKAPAEIKISLIKLLPLKSCSLGNTKYILWTSSNGNQLSYLDWT